MNKPVAWRNDAYAKVTGKARYTDDIKVHGCLHAVPVYSEYTCAILHSIDTEAALSQPGVVRVITAADIPGKKLFGQIIQDYPFLADKHIHSNGDVVALIVATSRAAAINAIPYVKINATPTQPVLDAEAALLPSSPLVHPEHQNNIANYHCVRRGDIKAGESVSDLIIKQVYQTSRIEHAYLEPESALCYLRPDGVMEVRGSMQHPYSTRRFVAAVLGSPLSDVEVITVPVGGGFGGKDDTAALVCARAALAAQLTGKPVKMTYSREWSLRESYKRHPYTLSYRMGLSRDGFVRFVQCRIIADGGAYCSVTPWVTWRSTVQCCGAYLVPHVHTDVYGVYTNNIFCGAMRGFGSPQVNFAVEQLVEIAADKLGMDEIAFRRQNMLYQDCTTITGQKLDSHTMSLHQVMDTVLTQIDYEQKRAQCSYGDPNTSQWYGIGFAISARGMSLGAEGTDMNCAIISVQPDGSVLLETAVHENGQGSESTMILLCAEHLSLPRELIRYRQASTSTIADGGTTVASRGTIMGGGAVVKAAQQLIAQISEVIAPDLHCAASEIALNDAVFSNPDDTHSLTWQQAIRLMYNRQCYPYSFGVFQAPRVDWDEHTGQGNAYFTWVYACQAVELSIDPQTKKVTLLNMIAAHDVGKAVNPAMLEGQFYGGMTMAAGYALMEECEVKDGKVVPTNLHQYRIPRSTDLPEMMAFIVENPDPQSPSHAKGIGEPTNELMAPAIANAVYRATGKRYYTQPLKIITD